MPELPDIILYVESLRARVLGSQIENIRVASPFIIRSVHPPIQEAIGKRIQGIERIGKRIIFELEDELFIIIHLMIAGRFHWKKPEGKLSGKVSLLSIDIPNGSLFLTEASTKKRASLPLDSRASVPSSLAFMEDLRVRRGPDSLRAAIIF